MLIRISYSIEPLNMEATKKIINNWEKAEDRGTFSDDFLYLNMYSYADMFRN